MSSASGNIACLIVCRVLKYTLPTEIFSKMICIYFFLHSGSCLVSRVSYAYGIRKVMIGNNDARMLLGSLSLYLTFALLKISILYYLDRNSYFRSVACYGYTCGWIVFFFSFFFQMFMVFQLNIIKSMYH